MSYESAPATEMVATRCACCSRPLVDANSVEVGVGPICRERYGYGEPDTVVSLDAVTDELNEPALAVIGDAGDAHEAANRVVYAIAAEQSGPAVDELTETLAKLGYTRLSQIIAQRLAKLAESNLRKVSVHLIRIPQGFQVLSPYREDAPWRSLRARWDRGSRTWIVPQIARKGLWALLKEHYAGCWMRVNDEAPIQLPS
jgi:hypothetical protein